MPITIRQNIVSCTCITDFARNPEQETDQNVPRVCETCLFLHRLLCVGSSASVPILSNCTASERVATQPQYFQAEKEAVLARHGLVPVREHSSPIFLTEAPLPFLRGLDSAGRLCV